MQHDDIFLLPFCKNRKNFDLSNMKIIMNHTYTCAPVNWFSTLLRFHYQLKGHQSKENVRCLNTYAIFKRLFTLNTFILSRNLHDVKVAWVINKIVPPLQNRGLTKRWHLAIWLKEGKKQNYSTMRHQNFPNF